METSVSRRRCSQPLLASVSMFIIGGVSAVLFSAPALANCTAQPAGSNTYICSGAMTSGQILNTNPNSTISTDSTYSIVTPAAPGGPALQISGNGTQTFIDTNGTLIDTSATPAPTARVGFSIIMGADLPGTPASAILHSNGTFRTSGNGVAIASTTGVPASGFVDVQLTGTIEALRGRGLSVIVPGQGGTIRNCIIISI